MNTIKQQPVGLGFQDLGDLSSLLNDPTVKDDNIRPKEIRLDLIDEDPNQPRQPDNPGFSKDSLEDLAVTIRLRGVKSPISIRENLQKEGYYLINHGARRYRASILADKTSIPAFVDNDYNEADQIIENLQRNELTPREVSDFIGRELAKGKKKGEIAKEIGKSPAFITQHVTLLDLPERIAEAFNNGRTKDVTIINELVTAHKKHPDDIDNWLLDDSNEITRGSVKLLREFLESKREVDNTENQDSKKIDQENQVTPADKEQPKEKTDDPTKLKKTIVQVLHNDRPARLLLKRRPQDVGLAWLKYDDGEEFEADLSTVQLVALLDG
jgi:ParB family chromosome partitioning protein